MSVLREQTKRLAKFRMIAQKAKENPELQFTSLAHYLTAEYLIDSYRNLNKSASSGVDKVDYYSYELDLSKRIDELHKNLRNKTYVPQPIQRVWIDKSGGKKRPLGVSTVEDKIVQKAVSGILNRIYEQDFYSSSYGFRSKRSAHQALSEIHKQCMKWDIEWIIDADIQGCFDNFDHNILRELLKKRIKDKSLLHLIDLWLESGIIDGKSFHINDLGTPQGNIISPLLCNIYLHYVLDQWLNEVVSPLLKGRIFLVRYADDFIIGLSSKEDAQKVMQTLPKRMDKYGLTIHPEKSKLLHFSPPRGKHKRATFDFLGFTHYWAKSLKGRNVLKRRTSKKSQKKAMDNMYETSRKHRHERVVEQYRRLKSKLHGIYNYFGIRGNFFSINTIYQHALHSWFKWLNRRSQKKSFTWQGYKDLLKQFQLPVPKIVHKNV